MSGFILLFAGLTLAVFAPRITGMSRWVRRFPVYRASVYYVRLTKPARVVEGAALELWATAFLLSAAQYAPLPVDWQSLLDLFIEGTFITGVGIILLVALPWAILGLIVPQWSPVRPAEDGVKVR